jgi:hypothetical protein
MLWVSMACYRDSFTCTHKLMYAEAHESILRLSWNGLMLGEVLTKLVLSNKDYCILGCGAV